MSEGSSRRLGSELQGTSEGSSSDIPRPTDLEFTGERFIPGYGGVQIHFEHVHRYSVASRLLRSGYTVLDYGSGAGYGADLLAERAGRVLGVDVSAEAVAVATARYRRANLEYRQVQSARVPLPDASVDLITCFEVIEHLTDQTEVVAEFARVLKPDGLLLISTPERRTYSDRTGYANPFHKAEMTFEEFDRLVAECFASRHYYRQRFTAASLILPVERLHRTSVSEFSLRFEGNTGYERLATPVAEASSPLYYLAICAKADIPEAVLGLGEILVDDLEAFAHEHTQELESLKRYVMECEKQNAELSTKLSEAARGHAELRAVEQALIEQIEPLKKHIVVLEGGVGMRDSELAQLREREARLSAEVAVAIQERDVRASRLDEILRDLEDHKRRLLVQESELVLLAQREREERRERERAESEAAAAELARVQERTMIEFQVHTRAAAMEEEKSTLKRRLEEVLAELEVRKQHIMRLEGGVAERDEQIWRLSEELREVKQSGALRVGRVISRALPPQLKRRLYRPFRRQEESGALDLVARRPGASVRSVPAAIATEDPSTPPRLRFSFVVPVYNHAAYLPLMVESLLDQRRKADEIILVDDCSPDPEVRTILQRYEGRHGVKVIYSAANQGISCCTNLGVQAATGTHVAFVDCDDLVQPEALEKVEAFLTRNADVDFVYTNRIDIDEDGVEVARWDFTNRATAPAYEALLVGMFTSHLKVVSSAALRDVGLYKGRYDLSQDYDLALRLAECKRLGHLNAFVYRHRVHRRQQSQLNNARQEAITQQIREDSYRRMSVREGKSTKLVSIVMLTLNRPEITRRAIESILSVLKGSFELLIFDNGSDAETRAMLAGYEGRSRVKVVLSDRNYGVSGGRLRAAQLASGDYLFFIDSDIVIEDSDLLVKLVERLEEEPLAAACCCKVVFPNGEIQFNGGTLERIDSHRIRFSFIDAGKRHDDLSATRALECEWIPGGATLWRREAHERFAPNDQMLGAFEDNEVCLRVRKAGLKLLNCPTAEVVHHHHSFRQEQDEKYLKTRYDPARIIASMGVIYRDHGLLVHDEGLYRMLGFDPNETSGLVQRLMHAVQEGKTNATA